MKILFDQGTPVPLRKYLSEHTIDTAFEKGWSSLTNGDLLQIAEVNDYNLLVTTDQNLRYQQNLSRRKIAIIVLLSTSWPRIKQHIDMICDKINKIQPSQYSEIKI